MSASHQLFPAAEVDGILWKGFALRGEDGQRGLGPDYNHEGEEVGLWVSVERDGSWSAAIEAGPLLAEGSGRTACEALDDALEMLREQMEHTSLLIAKCFGEPGT